MKIKYVNQPKKPDGKFGNIKMETGETFFVNVGRLNLYKVGMEIEPSSEPQKWGDNVVQVIRANFDPTGGANTNTPPPAPGPAPAAPRPAPNGNGVSKDVQIATIALMKSFIESGSFGLTDLPALEAACIPTARSIVKRTADGT